MFASGREFLLSLESRRPDCLLLDLGMPAMNGLDVLARLAASGHRVPVVAVTGSTDRGLGPHAAHDGGTTVLRKPIDDQVLLDAVGVAISRTGA